MTAARIALLALWAWLAIEWRSVPGALLSGLLCLMAGQAAGRYRPAVDEWGRRRNKYPWLEQTSRTQLRAERASQRRDLHVGLATGIPAALVGAAAGAALVKLLGTY